MTDRPVIFSAPMIQALLAGRKRQTRRILSPATAEFGSAPAEFWKHGNFAAAFVDGLPVARRQYLHVPAHEPACGHCEKMGWEGSTHRLHPRVEPWDKLWVREAFSYSWAVKDDPDRRHLLPCWYWADGNPETGDWSRPKPSIHMPRWASRLTLDVTDVRVQRLQDISEADAEAEGIERFGNGFEFGWGIYDRERLPDGQPAFLTKRASRSFASLWNSLHGADAWQSNPWVVVLTFNCRKGNIDG